MLRLYLCKGFNNLLEQDDKGDVSAETTGPAPAEVSAGIQISAERLLCYWLIPNNDNLFLNYNNANLRLVEDLEHNGGGIPNSLSNSPLFYSTLGYGFIYIFGRSPRVREIILIQSWALSSFLFCLGRESRQMSASRQMSFLLNSGSFLSELLQYNFFPQGSAAFEFCQGRSIPGILSEITNKLATISALTNMVKNMQRQTNTQEVKALDAFCKLCGNNHDTSECGQAIESSCYVGNYNKNVMSNTYNPAWRNHPNFSWKNQNNALNPQQPNPTGFQNQPRQNSQQNLPRQEYQQPDNYKTLENTLTQFMAQTSAYMARTDRFIQKTDAFMDRTEMKLQNHDATLKSLETQVGQISQILNTRPIGGFPSDTEVAKGATHKQCKAITTRSGKILEPTRKQRGTITYQIRQAGENKATPTISTKVEETRAGLPIQEVLRYLETGSHQPAFSGSIAADAKLCQIPQGHGIQEKTH
ncbi:hypothetical protein V6N12_051312 [Hibiscus sabdariffa]|uniref:Uncharacterized protein n=1 Tax=Hibiscus sabdariffa TaxID=183260 RepID=A0ABR2GF07_9ROSI